LNKHSSKKTPFALPFRKLLGIAAIAVLLFSQVQTSHTQTPFAQSAPADSFGWDIPSFTGDIKIQTDGSILVMETIVADYSNESHHGIYRTIPVNYRDRYGNKLSLRLQVLSVKDETGKDWDYTQSTEGDNINIQIGNADVLLDKPSTFILNYKLDRAITFFDDHDEIYWNLTGNDWGVDMKKVHATVTVPSGIAEADIKATCYTGAYGASEHNCTYKTQGQTTTFDVTTAAPDAPALQPGEGLTIVVGFPKNFVTPPTFLQNLLWILSDNWGYALPLIVFICLYYLWRTRGRDPKISRTAIMPIYTPPNKLTPTEIGTIIDESVDIKDISSAIIDLAIRGYIQIKELKEKVLFFDSTDYQLINIKKFEDDAKLKDHEKRLLGAIFFRGDTTKISALKNRFYKDLPGIKDAVYNELVGDGYFPTSPDKVRKTYITFGIILIAVASFGFTGISTIFSISIPIGIGASGLLLLAFAKFMPVKTKKGVETYYLIKGLEEYIGTAEKDRIKFQEKENIFEKLLPYAMTLGLATKWCTAFEGIYKTPPSWYTSTNPAWNSGFTPMLLMHSMDNMTNTMQTAFTSSPRSAAGGGSGFGGGFSGGGFGGGGGGSW
jgi:uncharacterized membrane protein